LLCHAQRAEAGSVTQMKRPPKNSGRFSPHPAFHRAGTKKTFGADTERLHDAGTVYQQMASLNAERGFGIAVALQ
ncbi:hypothetical protein, partial [Microcystis sp. M169S2]|uniref:hypothetical protein n=1 Tax=Microcystis sp. M169S2 TaxID=2771157 RepID=UPI00258CA648